MTYNSWKAREPDDCFSQALNHCDKCGSLTVNREDEYSEFVCESCRDNEAEQAWERFCSIHFGDSGPLPLRDQQIAAMKFK